MFEDGCNRESYYLQDDLGSVIRLLDDVGNFRESYGYDEFGQDLYGNQGVTQPFGFTGYQYDNVAGTYFAQAREYRAAEGRFAAMDIVKGNVLVPQTQNPYKYCMNQPFRYIDPSGCIEEESEIQSLNTESKGNVVEEIINENKYGLVTDGLGIANEVVGTSVKNGIVNATRPNNIGVGTWAKQVSQNLDDAVKVFGSSVDDVARGAANGIEGILPKGLRYLGYAGVAIDVGKGLCKNTINQSSVGKYISDVVVDVTLSGGSLIAATATSTKVGAVFGGIAGAVAGFVVGVALYWFTDVAKVNGKNLREYAKGGIK